MLRLCPSYRGGTSTVFAGLYKEYLSDSDDDSADEGTAIHRADIASSATYGAMSFSKGDGLPSSHLTDRASVVVRHSHRRRCVEHKVIRPGGTGLSAVRPR